jgi:hypothetical protein
MISVFGSMPQAERIAFLPVFTSVIGTAFVSSSHSCVMECAVKFEALKTLAATRCSFAISMMRTARCVATASASKRLA